MTLKVRCVIIIEKITSSLFLTNTNKEIYSMIQKVKMARVPYVMEDDKAYDPFSRMLKDRIIFVSGEFNSDMADSIVAQLLFLETEDSETDINMYINSPGGDMTAMYGIFDTMNYIKPDVVTIGYGMCASAGSFILAAGTKGKRFALPNTEIMIHELSTGMRGKANDILQEAKHIERVYERMAQYYVEFTGQKLMHRDFFMTSEEAQKYGLIDKVEYKRA